MSDRKVFRLGVEAAAKIETYAKIKGLSLQEAADAVVLAAVPTSEARAVESSDAIDAVQAYARAKGLPENEAADRLIELGWRRHLALQKHRAGR